MVATQNKMSGPPLSSDRACVSYLFRKRWPQGFKCPFCGAVLREMSPACVVICRYCRKQSSITANTLMHGSKKSLVAWLLVAWQFCLREQGLSARELQRLMELSSYQTAWSWLQKIRQGAALAESAKCRGTVLFDSAPLSVATAHKANTLEIYFALEFLPSTKAISRIRFVVQRPDTPDVCSNALIDIIEKGATVFVRDQIVGSSDVVHSYLCQSPDRKQQDQGQLLFQEMEFWLNRVYRRAYDISHLQSYLDEFSFRFNTSSWPDHWTVFDHLVTGLVSPVDRKPGRIS